MRFEVTRKDIKHGERSNCLFCPVATAVRRVFPNAEVWESLLWIRGLSSVNIDLPETVAYWICEFDFGVKSKPFSFSIAAENFVEYQRV